MTIRGFRIISTRFKAASIQSDAGVTVIVAGCASVRPGVVEKICVATGSGFCARRANGKNLHRWPLERRRESLAELPSP